MKVAGGGRHAVFDLLKKYFQLNYCCNFFITMHGTGVFLQFCFFFFLLCEGIHTRYKMCLKLLPGLSF